MHPVDRAPSIGLQTGRDVLAPLTALLGRYSAILHNSSFAYERIGHEYLITYDDDHAGEVDQAVSNLYERIYYTDERNPAHSYHDIEVADFRITLLENFKMFGTGEETMFCPMRLTSISRHGTSIVVASVPVCHVAPGVVSARLVVGGPCFETVRSFLASAVLLV